MLSGGGGGGHQEERRGGLLAAVGAAAAGGGVGAPDAGGGAGGERVVHAAAARLERVALLRCDRVAPAKITLNLFQHPTLSLSLIISNDANADRSANSHFIYQIIYTQGTGIAKHRGEKAPQLFLQIQRDGKQHHENGCKLFREQIN